MHGGLEKDNLKKENIPALKKGMKLKKLKNSAIILVFKLVSVLTGLMEAKEQPT